MIEQIENGIIARLRGASAAGALGYRYQTLETYPEEWDEYLKEKGAGIRAPAAWVVFAGFRARETEDSGRGDVAATFGLVVMAENARGETQTRHGGPNAASEPGSYRLAMDAAALLTGQDFGLPIDSISIGGLNIVRRMAALKERKVSMLALELRTGFSFSASGFGEDAFGDLRAFHANWDVEPFGGVDADSAAAGVQLPADAQADATDHLILESEA